MSNWAYNEAQKQKKEKEIRKKHGEEPDLRAKVKAWLRGDYNYRNMPELVRKQKAATKRAILKERLEKQRDRTSGKPSS